MGPARALLGQQQPPPRQKARAVKALRHLEVQVQVKASQQVCRCQVWVRSSLARGAPEAGDAAPAAGAPAGSAGPAPAGHTPDPSPRQMAEAIEAVTAQVGQLRATVQSQLATIQAQASRINQLETEASSHRLLMERTASTNERMEARPERLDGGFEGRW